MGGLLMTEATRFNAVAIITNIANADGNKMFMIAQPGFEEQEDEEVVVEEEDEDEEKGKVRICQFSSSCSLIFSNQSHEKHISIQARCKKWEMMKIHYIHMLVLYIMYPLCLIRTIVMRWHVIYYDHQ